MEEVQVEIEEDDITRLTDGLLKSFSVKEYKKLLDKAKECSSASGMKHSINSVLKLCRKKSAEMIDNHRVAATLTFFVSFLNKSNARTVRPLVCDIFPDLYEYLNHAPLIVAVLANVVANQYEESNVAKRSLKKIMSKHIEAFMEFPDIITNFKSLSEEELDLVKHENNDTDHDEMNKAKKATVSGKLLLLEILDEELQVHGTPGDKLKTFVRDLFEKLLEGVNQNDLEAIEAILRTIMKTSFFTNREEKRQAIEGLYTKKSLDCYLLMKELLGPPEKAREIEKAVGFAVSISKWIDGSNLAAWNTICDFTAHARNYNLEEFPNALLEKITFLTQRRSGTDSFKYIEYQNYQLITIDTFMEYFVVVKNALKCVTSIEKVDESLMVKLEKLLFIAYDILPPKENLHNFKDKRHYWAKYANPVIESLRNETEDLKRVLDKKTVKNNHENTLKLRRRLNIGVILLVLLSDRPSHRSHHITPSWISSWKPPLAVDEPKGKTRPLSHQSRKRKNSFHAEPESRRSHSQPEPSWKRARIPTARSRARANI